MSKCPKCGKDTLIPLPRIVPMYKCLSESCGEVFNGWDYIKEGTNYLTKIDMENILDKVHEAINK